MSKWDWRYDDEDRFWREIVIATKHPEYRDQTVIEALRDLHHDDQHDRHG